MSNRGDLQSACQRYLDFTAISDSDLQLAIDVTRTELGRLQVPENYYNLELTAEQGRVALPEDFRSAESVLILLAAGQGQLLPSPLPLVLAGAAFDANRVPTSYALQGADLVLNTQRDQELTLYYYGLDAVLGPEASDTTPILTAYPALYRHRCTAELAFITQDTQLAQFHLNQFDRVFADVQRVSRFAQAAPVSTGG